MGQATDDVLAAQIAAYARGRPDYPIEIESWLRDELGISAGEVAVDLGSGTGKFLPRLLATCAKVIAIEPLAQMRSALIAIHPGVDAREGRAQAIPLPDGSVDAVICAQCFHLFATIEALEEIRRVLKPGGVLGLVWNIRDATVPWVASIIGIMAPYDHGNIPFEAQEWKKLFPAKGFSALEEQSFANPQPGPPETIVVDRVLSTSAIAKLPQEERERVITSIRDVIASTTELAGREQITFPNTTYAYSCRKTA